MTSKTFDPTSLTPRAALAWNEPGVQDYVTSGMTTTNHRSIETYLIMVGGARDKATAAGIATPFIQMTASDVKRFVGVLRKEKSARQYFLRLRALYKYHEREDLRKLLPVLRADKTKVGPEDIFSHDELNRLLDAAGSKRDRVLIAGLYESGGRVSEVLALNMKGLERHQNGGNG